MTTYLSYPELQTLVSGVLESGGLAAAHAAAVARVIVRAEGDACRSHGIYRIPGVLRTLQGGQHPRLPKSPLRRRLRHGEKYWGLSTQPTLSVFWPRKNSKPFLIYCFRVSLVLNFNGLSHL